MKYNTILSHGYKCLIRVVHCIQEDVPVWSVTSSTIVPIRIISNWSRTEWCLSTNCAHFDLPQWWNWTRWHEYLHIRWFCNSQSDDSTCARAYLKRHCYSEDAPTSCQFEQLNITWVKCQRGRGFSWCQILRLWTADQHGLWNPGHVLTTVTVMLQLIVGPSSIRARKYHSAESSPPSATTYWPLWTGVLSVGTGMPSYCA